MPALVLLGGLFPFFGRDANTPKCVWITHLIIDLLTKTTQLDRFLIGIAIAIENSELFY